MVLRCIWSYPKVRAVFWYAVWDRDKKHLRTTASRNPYMAILLLLLGWLLTSQHQHVAVTTPGSPLHHLPAEITMKATPWQWLPRRPWLWLNDRHDFPDYWPSWRDYSLFLAWLLLLPDATISTTTTFYTLLLQYCTQRTALHFTWWCTYLMTIAVNYDSSSRWHLHQLVIYSVVY